ncbi:cysteine proteinase [Heliocybe sulcata]|uniref:Ubiquitin carboxyl-terminal hydrolase n=1 Tax=Heliocybe sulcata TaxID=5364 RepID=A0A5C3MTJ5_9AGAM|nr:cysteine proteinase [Heliocybe sulcata]
MPTLQVNIKHAGKTHQLDLNTDQPASAFKEAVSDVTGVPADRVKVMIKGGMLKDDTDWKKVAPKAGQTFMVIGAATELPKPPPAPVVFMEDLADTELAKASAALPVGLRNLGNTCYMNSTVQALRAIPELQQALSAGAGSLGGLPRALKDLLKNMSETTEAVTPMGFLSVLRQVAPQFAEMDRSKGGMMRGYAQQDAEECWTAITNALKEVPGPSSNGKFVEQYLQGEIRRELKCVEAPDEPPTVSFEKVLKIECNITGTTNFMLQGIMSALTQEVEKTSPTLGRSAVYTQTSRVSRLPAYLTVHMVRFAWRRDIAKKAKIMRKVKFPTEFDALDLVTDELKAKLQPLNRKLLDVEKARRDRHNVRKRTKVVASSSTPAPATSSSTEPESSTEVKMDVDSEKSEDAWREDEKKELESLVSEDLKSDVGCSVHGLYELVAIVTHKGAAADAGHYIGWAKKSVFGNAEEGDEDWYKFDDDKVSEFPAEKLATLDGGGEDSSAYVLLYKSRPL